MLHCSFSNSLRFARSTLTAICMLTATATASAQTPGALDTSFGGTGSVETAVSAGAGDDRARSLVIQPDGKIVVGGGCEGDFCLVRYLPNGTLDGTFGSGGRVIQNLMGSDTGYALVLQPDDKLVLVGACRLPTNLDGRMCAARFTTAGVLDTSFGAGVGWVSVNFTSGGDTARAVALQADGRIVMAGGCTGFASSTAQDFCLARLNPDGSPDTGFGTGGIVITTFGGGNAAQGAFAVAIQPNGFIVAAGSCRVGSFDSFCVARYEANGAQLDCTFGGGAGYVTTPVLASIDNRAYSVALQPNGKILVAGECGSMPCVARYLNTGGLDPSFSDDGKFGQASTYTEGGVGSLALSFDGSFIVAGWANPVAGIDNRSARRYTADGSEAGAFPSISATVYLNSGSQGWSAVAVQQDGKVVVTSSTAGTSSADGNFVVARFHGFPSEARNCSLDVDGDGKVLATVDGLISTRVMLGMSGNAVISGITFAAHAARKTWTDIRSYLIGQCGMSIQ
jgi:uncharacterized delta-60 repeat protein